VGIINAPIEISSQSNFWLEFTNILYYLLIALAFAIALFRYRLWDIDILINKALVYSLLTGMLGLIGVVSLAVVDFFIKKLAPDETSIWGAILPALPVAAAFSPLLVRIQSMIDRFFKPEEVNFKDTFIEFIPEVREMLTTESIIKTISEQVKKQLKLDFARVYFYQADSQLYPALGNPLLEENSQLVLEEKQLAQLQKGKIVVNDAEIPYSLLIPLIVPRANIPDFLGVIMLGKRLSGAGYSTPILNNLQSFGADAGKAIYLSRLSEQAKIKATS
jgi:hypothetical protein